MEELARRFPRPGDLQRRALNQAARELLLAQASDWAFILTAGTMVGYAEKRTREHLDRFLHLYRGLTENRLDEVSLRTLEEQDNLFPDMDYRIYA